MPNWLGDAVMATPALGNLRSEFPDARVTLVGSVAVAAMFANDPAYDAVIADASGGRGGRLWGARRLAGALRSDHGPFDLAVAFPNRLSSRLLLWFSGARHRLGARGGPGNLLLKR